MDTRPGLLEDLISETPMGRFAEPEEIAEAIVRLCSEPSSFHMGQSLAADGGFTTQ